ncbi:MAG: SusD/RagB family nutrient-binding outer membrane lipoprotein [Tannerellaceae bacterium]|jgi:hypothetical protein|nr:SusD/RagB family nutrient-binding outer membrane lipoprotein [Tannerellaceae bacterium]
MKNSIYLLVASALALVFQACSEDDFAGKYPDPSKIGSPTCEKLMTGVFVQSNTWITPGQGRYFGWASYVGRFAQVFGYPNTSGMYLPDSYGDPSAHWDDFYRSLATFRVLQDTYANLSDDKWDDQQSEQAPFLWLAQLFIYHQLTEIIGAWGDAPYSQAASLFLTGNIKKSQSDYDTQKDLYRLILQDLASIDSALAKYNVERYPSVKSKLALQDYIFKGDLHSWRCFANALRLRVALRLSSYGPLQQEAVALLAKLLTHENAYPLPSQNLCFYSTSGPDLKWTDLGLNDEGRFLGYAAHAHISRMLDDDDPRLTVTYDPAANGSYVGLDPSKQYDAQRDNGALIRQHYSSIDSSSFRKDNPKIPAILFSLAEILFIKAEVYHRGIVAGDAESAFKQAVIASVLLYWDINDGGSFRPEPRPDDLGDRAADFAHARWLAIGDDYTDATEAIATQKWLHFGFLQEFEAWCEVRRTGLPRLSFAVDAGSLCKNVPKRLKYPDNERLYNPHCPPVDEDKWENPLLWARP